MEYEEKFVTVVVSKIAAVVVMFVVGMAQIPASGELSGRAMQALLALFTLSPLVPLTYSV